MPRPGLPPTPGSSTEILGKDQVGVIEDLSLPPAALFAGNAGSAQSTFRPDTDNANEQTTTEPSGTKRKRRKPSVIAGNMQLSTQVPGATAESTFSIPPPPSRSRKIIQVQPEDAKGSSSKASTQGRKKGEPGGKGLPGSNGGTKPTAASRKTARKTAHSIIERRRRSKMNEEFETLKELVPAARGQNMHKLAILQAGIEYVRYLEDCVHGLKGVHTGNSSTKTTPFQAPPDLRPSTGAGSAADEDDDDDMDEDEDDDFEEEEQMAAKEVPQVTTPRASRPASRHQSQSSVSNTPSPAIHPLQTQYSDSSYALSTGSPSPAMPPSYNNSLYPNTAASSTLPSPALLPNDSRAMAHHGLHSGQMTPITSGGNDYHSLQAHARKALVFHGEADQEVIATLAMMGTERRRSQEERDRMDGTRGMSVRDLLSG